MKFNFCMQCLFLKYIFPKILQFLNPLFSSLSSLRMFYFLQNVRIDVLMVANKFKVPFYTKKAKTIVPFKTLISFLINKEDNLRNCGSLQSYSMSLFGLMSSNFDFTLMLNFPILLYK